MFLELLCFFVIPKGCHPDRMLSAPEPARGSADVTATDLPITCAGRGAWQHKLFSGGIGGTMDSTPTDSDYIQHCKFLQCDALAENAREARYSHGFSFRYLQ